MQMKLASLDYALDTIILGATRSMISFQKKSEQITLPESSTTMRNLAEFVSSPDLTPSELKKTIDLIDEELKSKDPRSDFGIVKEDNYFDQRLSVILTRTKVVRSLYVLIAEVSARVEKGVMNDFYMKALENKDVSESDLSKAIRFGILSNEPQRI